MANAGIHHWRMASTKDINTIQYAENKTQTEIKYINSKITIFCVGRARVETVRFTRLYFAGKLSWDITTNQVNSALHPSGVAKSSTSFSWGKGGKVTSAGWQVTLCDLIWHMISRSGVVISITNCYIRFTLLLLYDPAHVLAFIVIFLIFCLVFTRQSTVCKMCSGL